MAMSFPRRPRPRSGPSSSTSTPPVISQGFTSIRKRIGGLGMAWQHSGSFDKSTTMCRAFSASAVDRRMSSMYALTSRLGDLQEVRRDWLLPDRAREAPARRHR